MMRSLFQKAYQGARPDAGASISDEHGYVFGWAQIIARPDGTPIIDHQGDVTEPDELRKAVHAFMSRDDRPTGIMHLRDPETGEVVRSGQIVESLCVTPELVKALGIEGQVPLGWLIGVKVDHPVVRKAIRDGRMPSFSIGGRGVRVPVEIEEN